MGMWRTWGESERDEGAMSQAVFFVGDGGGRVRGRDMQEAWTNVRGKKGFGAGGVGDPQE